jgi:cytoskeletal protein CcmA (bactofilin family)
VTPEPTAEGRVDVPGPVLGPGTEFSGLLVLHGTACIEGSVRGEVIGAETLRIGERGLVAARVEAGEIVVAGRLEGEVHARRRLELAPTARVRASIETPCLAVAEGSRLEGRCRAGASLSVPDGKSPDTA